MLHKMITNALVLPIYSASLRTKAQTQTLLDIGKNWAILDIFVVLQPLWKQLHAFKVQRLLPPTHVFDRFHILQLLVILLLRSNKSDGLI